MTLRNVFRTTPATRRLRSGAVIAALCATSAVATMPIAPALTPAAFADVIEVRQLIVALHAGETIEALNQRHSTTTVNAYPGLGVVVITWADARTIDEMIAELELDPAVEFVDENREVRPPEVSFSGRLYKWTSAPPSAVGTQWFTSKLRLSEAHQLSRGAGVVVAVIDSGVDPTHPMLTGALVAGKDFVDGDNSPNDVANGIDDNLNGEIDEAAGHGTHVAGIVRQMAPAAKIMPVRVLDTDGQADTIRVAQAMLWAADNGADVLNLSLGQTGSSELLKQLSSRLWNRGVLVVGAAGNEAESMHSFPAAAKCAISVTATTSSDALADFASWGSKVDVAAPGVEIVSAYPFTTTRTAAWSGTSMASPIVAGEAALIIARNSRLSLGQVARLIVNNGAAIAGLPGSTSEIKRVNVVRALKAIDSALPTSNGCLQ